MYNVAAHLLQLTGTGYSIAPFVLIGILSAVAAYAYASPAKVWGSTPSLTSTKAYLLRCSVYHARLLPRESAHSFRYPTMAMLLPLRALESNALDLGNGYLFGYGPSAFNVTGIRPATYLSLTTDPSQSIFAKLQDTLAARGLPSRRLKDAWVLTMPTYLGYEGINPLTVYYCYDISDTLWIVVLEVHNTFGERHIYVLFPGEDEDDKPQDGFEHSWTFPRQFHVSPFNDRSGYYRCSVQLPSQGPSAQKQAERIQPAVKITLLTADDTPEVKLIASINARKSIPLSSRSLVTALIQTPFILFLSLPRILYQAFILHYFKRLDVFPRPDPHATSPLVESHLSLVANPVQDPHPTRLSGAIGWLPESWSERWARRRIEAFLLQRTAELNDTVLLVSSDPGTKIKTFPNSAPSKNPEETLIIYYRSPKAFTTILLAPSPQHAIMLGSRAEGFFTPSSEELFIEIFSASPSPNPAQNIIRTRISTLCTHAAQSIRRKLIPPHIQSELEVPPKHCLDRPMDLTMLVVLSFLCIAEALERILTLVFRVRFVAGFEPWEGWNRLDKTSLNTRTKHGSIRS
ncbi:hypothetical protein SISSUDRAFT_1062608 [Sistotremastrum suecicum HHB10207 ss-3]|uniref:DUF1365-domain-containing protein n=1 Tax=Sistotremastrum suecicum HHB10207 ss-3 TaxID=1314776 RepID=A0A166CPN9_9AGAM|nr:hypothetical protein SISSUDRAFT_1062608 [Sistotremastrum suecicum HHB10207 ss-3]